MYQWLVFAHLVGLVIFALCHGVSVFVAFRVRRIDDPTVAAGYLQLSQSANRAMYLGLLLLAVGGIGAASVNNLWGQTWVWSSVVVLIAVIALMYVVGASYYYRLRDALAGKDGAEPIDRRTADRAPGDASSRMAGGHRRRRPAGAHLVDGPQAELTDASRLAQPLPLGLVAAFAPGATSDDRDRLDRLAVPLDALADERSPNPGRQPTFSRP